jgi:hypothetical protein
MHCRLASIRGHSEGAVAAGRGEVGAAGKVGGAVQT